MKKVIRLFCLIVCMTGFFTNSAQAKIFEDDWVQGLVVDQNGEAVSVPVFLRRELKMER